MTTVGYFETLSRMVRGGGYSCLLKTLHSLSFFAIIPHDENRAFDGLDLRRQLHVNGTEDIPCTMLEMMIALSEQMAYEVLDSICEIDRADIFWEMIGNLGLGGLDDDAFYELDGRERVELAVERLLNRTYSPNGKGGLFPLRESRFDQREVELWYQAQAYICENYLNLD